MENAYFIDFANGVKKATGRAWFAIRLFGLNKYGNIDIVPVFVNSEEEFELLKKNAPPQFSAVRLLTDRNGTIVEFKALDSVPKLNVK